MRTNKRKASSNAMSRELGISFIVLLLIISIYIVGCLYVYNFYIDDAFISLRYAKNLVTHGQLTYNLGEQPVEGYTNFLLVLIEALFIKLGVQDVINIPKIVGIISGILAIILINKLSSKIIDSELKYFPCFLFAVSIPVIMWSIAGLETAPFILLILGGIYYFINSLENNQIEHSLASDMFFFLAFLCRPEGLIFWVMSYIFIFLNRKKGVTYRNKIKSMLLSLILICVYLAWKYYYFGNLLPTTFYAKHQALSPELLFGGMIRFVNLMENNFNVLYFILFIFAALVAFKQSVQSVKYMIILSMVYCLYVISLGYSVAMDMWFRFYSPFLPLLYIVGAYGLSHLLAIPKLQLKVGNELQKKLKYSLFAVLCTAQLATSGYTLYYYWNFDSGFNDKSLAAMTNLTKQDYERLGKWLGERFSPSNKIVLGDIGVIGYYSNLKVIDLWSLLDRNIIDLKSEQLKYKPDSKEYKDIDRKILRYIFDQNPDIFLLNYLEFRSDPRSKNYVLIDVPFNQYVFVKRDFVGPGTYSTLYDFRSEE